MHGERSQRDACHTSYAIPALAQHSPPFNLHGLRRRIRHGVVALGQGEQQVKPPLAHQPIALNTGAMLVKPHSGVQPRHAPINKGLAQLVVWATAAKPGDPPDLVGPLNHTDMAGVAVG